MAIELKDLFSAFNSIPFNQMLGLELQAITPTSACMSFARKDGLIGNYVQNILHGGVTSAVLDMAGGMVVMAGVLTHQQASLAEAKQILSNCSTIDLNINFLRPGRGSHFFAKADLIKYGNRVSFTRMELTNQDQELIATASGTYIYTTKKAAPK